MKAEIITIGDEILIGQIVDTNSQWIGTELNKIGVSVYQISSIQDDKQHILNALKEAQERADLVIITGGLGPTKDDITKHTIAEYFNDTLTLNEDVVHHIKTLFAKYDIPFGELNRLQGMIPTKATYLKNEYGTAPGMWFYENETVFVSLPGVPNEMKGLMTAEILPRIQEQFKLPFIIHKTLMTYGQGESLIAERIEEFENNLPSIIKLAYLPNYGRVRLRLSAKGDDKKLLEDTLQEQIVALYKLIPDIISGFDEGGKIEDKIGALLTQNGKTICTAESLTGGKIASILVSVAGASVYYKGSFVAYSAETKVSLLGVSLKTIEKYSVVSKEVAIEMAKGAKEKLQTNYALAVTGNAGPTIDDTDKSLGVVFIALVTDTEVFVEEFNFGKPRGRVIDKTVNKSLEILQKKILKNS
ncbi:MULTISPECIES: CinA family nicotinamide mononucleotide deamidase-related protein [unclassified Polaribacter]|uniref:CinA family nicotinamide mononucleotide deamidase-related protein n=1 Tax=unclassified Polaribacter TaxID=196858 RepID=UPI0011BEF079|nr:MULTISPECIES: CinA family nicotinamide mononucleotide deamidase-related protein [unclassified Polaribacter]TXD52996.1 CinA family nicotinamide mononucleotide deamidase-related protein [Polaribacter sp. IC063]TXD60912.1 CinA family nicotinamide mononucleotide deamidase-related protein [Polaribacter sp. IC066]